VGGFVLFVLVGCFLFGVGFVLGLFFFFFFWVGFLLFFLFWGGQTTTDSKCFCQGFALS